MVRVRIYLRRTWPALILTAVLVVLTISCVLGPLGPRDLLILRADMRGLEGRRAALAAENAELGTRVQKLRSDSRYLEHLIRLELGYTRDHELVYKFASNTAANSNPSSREK
ncbi:MAG TPA: septum formation initiator family protein [Candidatus Binataceae bacterium]